MKWPSTKLLPWLLIFGIVVFQIVKNFILPNFERESGSTSYNQRNIGLSIADNFFRRQNADYTLYKQAFLDPKDLEKIKTLVISSPLTAPSTREARILQEFVRRGGNLVLLVSSEQSHQLFSSLRQALNISTLPIEENPEFKDKQVETVRFGNSQFLFHKDEEYAIYSDLQFRSEDCVRDLRGPCFAQINTVGSGQVLTMLGIPLLSNTMITRAQNSHFAIRLNRDFGPLGIDEYHHFFSQYTFMDLLKMPQFSIPMFGFLLFMIAYFSFARSRLHDLDVTAKIPVLTQGFHHLSQRVVASQLRNDKGLGSAVGLQSKVLTRLYPQLAAEIKKIETSSPLDPFKTAKALIQFHKNQIARLRGKKT